MIYVMCVLSRGRGDFDFSLGCFTYGIFGLFVGFQTQDLVYLFEYPVLTTTIWTLFSINLVIILLCDHLVDVLQMPFNI